MGLHNRQARSGQLTDGLSSRREICPSFEFSRSKSKSQGWFAGAAVAPSQITLPPDGRGDPVYL